MNEAHTHAVPTAAEQAAADKVEPHVASIKADILRRMAAAGDAGLIASEVPGLINTVRRRFVDLQRGGRIKPNGKTRANERGNPETVYVLGRDEKAVAQRATPFADLKTAVKTLLKRNGGPIDGFVQDDPTLEKTWEADAYVMVRREDFDALDKLTKEA